MMATTTLTIGDDLEVYRFGFGAMRITGDGIWGEPSDASRLPRSAAADRADRREPDRHRRLVRPGGVRAPDRGGAAPVPRQRRDRDQGRTRAPGAEPLGRQLPARAPQALLRGLAAAAQARADRPLPAAQGGSERADRGLRRRAGRVARGAEDPPYRPVQRQRSSNSNARGRSSRSCRCRIATTSPTASPRRSSRHARRAGWRSFRGRRLGAAEAATWRRPAARSTAAARAHGASPGQVALAWLLHHSPVILPIPGTSSIAHFEENLEAVELELDQDELDALDEVAS